MNETGLRKKSNGGKLLVSSSNVLNNSMIRQAEYVITFWVLFYSLIPPPALVKCHTM